MRSTCVQRPKIAPYPPVFRAFSRTCDGVREETQLPALSCPRTRASMAASVAIGDRARGLAARRWIPAFAGMTGGMRRAFQGLLRKNRFPTSGRVAGRSPDRGRAGVRVPWASRRRLPPDLLFGNHLSYEFRSEETRRPPSRPSFRRAGSQMTNETLQKMSLPGYIRISFETERPPIFCGDRARGGARDQSAQP